jgi:hypothetical protein
MKTEDLPLTNPCPAWSFREMELFQTVQCPFCAGCMDVGIDTTVSRQSFTTDCEVCCRPFEVRAECEPGEILSLEVLGTG